MAREGADYDIDSILAEMREQYWQELAVEEAEQREETEFVTFTMGGETFAFESTRAAEVIRIPKLVRLPRAHPLVAGIFNLRGAVTAAMDLRPFLQLPQPPLGAPSRIIILKSERFNTGILVESVRGVEPFPPEAEPVVRTLSPMQREFIRGQVTREGEITLLLDMAALLASRHLLVDQK